jgi:hypothetical protein
MGAKVGSADVKVDGSTYTFTGEATGADIKRRPERVSGIAADARADQGLRVGATARACR